MAKPTSRARSEINVPANCCGLARGRQTADGLRGDSLNALNTCLQLARPNQVTPVSVLVRKAKPHEKQQDKMVIRPRLGWFVPLCICAGLLFGGGSIWMGWYLRSDLLHAIAVYFAMLNAAILGVAVAVCLYCSESYDMD